MKRLVSGIGYRVSGIGWAGFVLILFWLTALAGPGLPGAFAVPGDIAGVSMDDLADPGGLIKEVSNSRCAFFGEGH